MVKGTWTYDASHYPEPMSPLSADIWFWAMGRGIQCAARVLRAPFGGFDTMIVDGGWAYERDLEPDWKPDVAALEAAALSIAERWEQDYRDRSHAITDELLRLRPQRLPAAEAVVAYDRLPVLGQGQGDLHFLAVVPGPPAAESL